jgi:hypothetical protein
LTESVPEQERYVALGQIERQGRKELLIMWDTGCIVASVAFFLASIAYTTGCERLGVKESK